MRDLLRKIGDALPLLLIMAAAVVQSQREEEAAQADESPAPNRAAVVNALHEARALIVDAENALRDASEACAGDIYSTADTHALLRVARERVGHLLEEEGEGLGNG